MMEAPNAPRIPGVPDETVELFSQGIQLGRVWSEKAARGLTKWVEERPEQVVVAGLLAGFVLGKILFRPRRNFSREK
jgi:hypothetical protein